MLEAPPRALRVVTQVVEIALGDHSKCADRRQRAALGAVDLVHAVTLAYLLCGRVHEGGRDPRERVTRDVHRRSRSLCAPRLPKLRSQESPRSLPSSDRGSYLSHMSNRLLDGHRSSPIRVRRSAVRQAIVPIRIRGGNASSGAVGCCRVATVLVASAHNNGEGQPSNAMGCHLAFHRETRSSSCIAAGLDHYRQTLSPRRFLLIVDLSQPVDHRRLSTMLK